MPRIEGRLGAMPMASSAVYSAIAGISSRLNAATYSARRRSMISLSFTVSLCRWKRTLRLQLPLERGVGTSTQYDFGPHALLALSGQAVDNQAAPPIAKQM